MTKRKWYEFLYIPRSHSGVPYRGDNVEILKYQSFKEGYTNERWCTFGHSLRMGKPVMCGENGTLINGIYGNKLYVVNLEKLNYKYY